MKIFSNGSKWAGQEPDPPEVLLALLRDPEEVLDERICSLQDPHMDNGMIGLFGNFLTRSHVFNIVGTRDEMQELLEAFEAAKARLEYQEQVEKEKQDG